MKTTGKYRIKFFNLFSEWKLDYAETLKELKALQDTYGVDNVSLQVSSIETVDTYE